MVWRQIVNRDGMEVGYRKRAQTLFSHKRGNALRRRCGEMQLTKASLDAELPGGGSGKVNRLSPVLQNPAASLIHFIDRIDAPQPDHCVDQILHFRTRLRFFLDLGRCSTRISGVSPP